MQTWLEGGRSAWLSMRCMYNGMWEWDRGTEPQPRQKLNKQQLSPQKEWVVANVSEMTCHNFLGCGGKEERNGLSDLHNSIYNKIIANIPGCATCLDSLKSWQHVLCALGSTALNLPDLFAVLQRTQVKFNSSTSGGLSLFYFGPSKTD